MALEQIIEETQFETDRVKEVLSNEHKMVQEVATISNTMIHRDRTPEKYADLTQSTSNMIEGLLLPKTANTISPL